MPEQPTAISASPFPRRFARADRHTDRGPNPGELLPFPPPQGNAVMELTDYFPAAEVTAIQAHGSISFHALGDSGTGSAEQQAVAETMARDIDLSQPERGPAFLLHLGDILYGPDKMARYAGRFYRPNDTYHNLIFAIPGNHDGEMRSSQDTSSLQAYLANFCQPTGEQPQLGVQFGRAMPHQPGAYWRLTCPFMDIIGLYSGTGENFGAIAHPEIGNGQRDWLAARLNEIAAERAAGTNRALIIAVHHPPYASGLKSGGFGHPGNPEMLQDIDDCCRPAHVWPNAVLSAHAHNYQRYMRTLTLDGGRRTIPYLIAGGGGISAQPAPEPTGTTADTGDDHVAYENGLSSYGYLLVTVSATTLTTGFVQATAAERSVFETVTMDLAEGRQL